MSGPVRIEKLPSEIALTWVDERALEMVLADNTTYKIPLVPAETIPGLVVPCLFFGTIDGDPESVVSVSGCKDNDTEVWIGSKKIVGGLADLFLSAGKTYEIHLHYTREKVSANKNRTRRRAGLQPSEVKLSWRRSREIDVVYADGSRDQIQLRAVSNLPGEASPCLFTGSLHKDEDSYVTIVGCRGAREVTVEILSERVAGGGLELIMSNGRTYKVSTDNTNLRGIPDDAPASDRGEDHGIASQIASWNGPLPQSVILEISLRYDNTLLAEFGNDHTRVKHWLSGVVLFAKPLMLRIGLSVELKVVGTVEHFNKNIRATKLWRNRIAETENRGARRLISYFSASKSIYLCNPT